MKRGHIARVAAISVGPRRIGRCHQPRIGDDLAFFRCPVGTGFDVVDLRDGDVVAVDHVAADMWQRRFLAEEKTGAGNAMRERNALYRETSVFKDNLIFGGVNCVKLNAIVKSVAEKLHLFVKQRPQRLRRVDVQRCRAPEHSKG